MTDEAIIPPDPSIEQQFQVTTLHGIGVMGDGLGAGLLFALHPDPTKGLLIAMSMPDLRRMRDALSEFLERQAAAPRGGMAH